MVDITIPIERRFLEKKTQKKTKQKNTLQAHAQKEDNENVSAQNTKKEQLNQRDVVFFTKKIKSV